MAEIVLFGHKFGLDGVGRNIGAKKITPLSATKTWEVTVAKNVTATFDHFKSYGGPFKPGTYHTLADDRIKNSGDDKGDLYLSFVRLDADGNVQHKFCEKTTASDIAAGNCAVVNSGSTDGGYACNTMADKECDNTGSLNCTVPSDPGTYYYGCKCWGEGEDEPSWPSPTEAIYKGRVVYPTAIPQLEPWQWAVIGVGTLVGIGIGYVASKELL